jgi:hypothetical protein
MNKKQPLETQIEFYFDFADKNNLKTIWSIIEVKDINEISPFEGDYLTDGINDIQIPLPNVKLTWLELWKHADTLYEMINDPEHMFIEEFEMIQNNGKTELHVFFGS